MGLGSIYKTFLAFLILGNVNIVFESTILILFLNTIRNPGFVTLCVINEIAVCLITVSF
jgi:hypothetical protein